MIGKRALKHFRNIYGCKTPHYISHIWVSKIIWCQNEILCHSSHNVEVKDDLSCFQLMCVYSYPCNSWSLKCKHTIVSSYLTAEIFIIVGYCVLLAVKGAEPQITKSYLLSHVNFSKGEGLQMGAGWSYRWLNVFNEKLFHVHAKERPCLLKNLQQTSTFIDMQ